MSVYTVLSAEQINQFAQGYGKTVQRITPIQQGIENSNWFVDMVDGQRTVLTVFEELDAAGAGSLADLLDAIAQHGLPVAAPFGNTQGQRLSVLADKPAQLAPCLQGQHPMQPTPAQCAAMGEGLARLHMAMQSVALDKPNAHGQAWWQHTASTLKPSMPADDQTLLEGLFAQFDAIQMQVGAQIETQTETQIDTLPRGLIHGDLFRDNTLFDGDALTGLLDFSECCVDDYLLDIAITLNDFCSAWPSVQLDQAKKTAFIAGYEQVRAFTNDEKNALPVYLAMAAGRFWLSRLQVAERNASEGRVSEHVLQKDPNEMREMVRDRLKLVVYTNYPQYPSEMDMKYFKVYLDYDADGWSWLEERHLLWKKSRLVCDLIIQAFGDVALEEGIGLFESQAIDNHANDHVRNAARHRDERMNWQKISTRDLNICYSASSFVDAKGLRFILPEFIVSQLNNTYRDDIYFCISQKDDDFINILNNTQKHAVMEFFNLLLLDDYYQDDWFDIKENILPRWLGSVSSAPQP